MNYRLQLSPISNPRDSPPLTDQWNAPPASWEDVKFFRSWLVYDSDIEINSSRDINWSMVLGLALAMIVSATFWTGLGFTIAYFWQ